ncbi:MAG: Stk1 family PASTA domain-containing Ser/Thr kinase [Clostridia bacterium]|nr:Stk1 family PASTA domain-containing Ser/Thr kinase [Clostridia bacterium]
MEGQILGNRYELLEKIGGGGMALVYKAKCKLLNRFVALKILRPEFTNDEEFVKRFRVEAQSAASLSHPNVVSIYDVGHEGNVHFIVMEYINGITLKEYITNKGALKWEEAVKISIQICSAIEHAHRNHIVHRDIKPHNILMTKDGIAKVTDFGIARAVSSSTITMVGSTIGSVHYFSPEQARGGFTDEKSDLYSLGIGLYEMVTGRVPFDGETPVAVALQHIQDEPKHPIEINSEVPAGVNSIIMKAIKKDKNARYQSATEMLGDLNRVLREPKGGFVTEVRFENFATRRIEAIKDSELAPKAKQQVDKSETNIGKDDKGKKKTNKLTYWLAGATSLVIIVVCILVTYNVIVSSLAPDNENAYMINDYVGKDYNTVKNELVGKGIIVKEKRKTDDTAQKDTIISQSISPGKNFKAGGYTEIELVVSDGPKKVRIPQLKNKDYRDAVIMLEDRGLVTNVQEEFSEDVGTGLVIRTEPGYDEEVKEGSEVTVYKSKGPELKMVKIPDLIGKTEMEAQRALADLKLTIGKIIPENTSNRIDKVIRQNPLPGDMIKEGTPIDIYFEEVKNEPRKEVKVNIILNNLEDFGDKIQVRIEAIPSDTNTKEFLVNEEKSKTDFPLPLNIPVPNEGKTKVSIYLDDKLYNEFEQE